MTLEQINFDGLVGPSHHYGGLSYGNRPSMTHGGEPSNPRRAALQGLEKMRRVSEAGIRQIVLPPAPRPDIETARQLGFQGDRGELLSELRDHPELLSSLYSASSMWAANAATTVPSVDAEDDTTHFVVANLMSTLHRSLEPKWTQRVLNRILPSDGVTVHPPLPSTPQFRDEGAANHIRLSGNSGEPGYNIFVYNEEETPPDRTNSDYPRRQTEAACRALTRLHRLPPERTFVVQQHPDVPVAGGFHNDLVAVGHRNVLFHHERAFANPSFLDELQEHYQTTVNYQFYDLSVSEDDLPLKEAIESYLFNSQLLPKDDDRLQLLAAATVNEHSEARSVVESILSGDNPIESVQFVELQQSMKNGGGPACLRLKSFLPEKTTDELPASLMFDASLKSKLDSWIKEYYREKVTLETLGKIAFYEDCREALVELQEILDLPGLY